MQENVPWKHSRALGRGPGFDAGDNYFGADYFRREGEEDGKEDQGESKVHEDSGGEDCGADGDAASCETSRVFGVFFAGELDVTADGNGVKAVSGLAADDGGYAWGEAEGELFHTNSEEARSDEVTKLVDDDQGADDYEEKDDRGHRGKALARGQVTGPAVGGEDIFERGFKHRLVAFQDSFDDMEDVVETDAAVEEELHGHLVGGAEDGGVSAAFLARLDG